MVETLSALDECIILLDQALNKSEGFDEEQVLRSLLNDVETGRDSLIEIYALERSG